jgi:hypothetical protein
MGFVILTPHLWSSGWRSLKERKRHLRNWATLVETARAAQAKTGVTLIPGVEFGVPSYGHFSVSGIDLGTLAGADDFLVAARAAGAFIVVNHPFAVPTKIPGIPESRMNLSFRRWTEDKDGFDEVDGVEAWNLPLGMANLISAPGGATGEERAFSTADRIVRAEARRLAMVGGTDNHAGWVMPTTWVLAEGGSAEAILEALRGGAICLGGPEAGGLRAHGDGDPAGRWASIGDAVTATARVELVWSGRARLFIDGVDAGEHDDGYVDEHVGGAAAIHTYRIVIGASRSGFLYANLP